MGAQCVVILGAGHGGSGAAASLRAVGFAGRIVLAGNEAQLPYHRPPLSKAWLKREVELNDVLIRSSSFYEEQNIELHLGWQATRIDRDSRCVLFENGEALFYDVLILALGARARRLALPGVELKHVLSLRTVDDALDLREVLRTGKTLCVIGGGYVGLEAAAAARALGSEVVVIERESRLLPRVAGGDLSAFFRRSHTEHGVRFEMSAGTERIEGENGAVSGVRLTDGRLIPCSAVLVGVGAVPNMELAQEAGLACENGVVVDMQAATSDPAIYAVGDMTWRTLPHYGGRHFRLESVPNAAEQGRQAAAAICGTRPPVNEAPWFWSDQYDIKLQIAGLALDVDRSIVRGDVSGHRFSVVHLRGDVIEAVEAVNIPADFMAGRQAIASGAKVDVERLKDASVPLKQCLL